ncbi:hypothetical protein [Candidatus Palauibacter sp.]|uniref:hypothetical protein n=1 Tax=Candidatus Palauibacter sp. TaxID=3101350 RepID=UPI003B0293BE
MNKDRLAEMLKKNPKIDPTALDRSRHAAKQLADVGIELGGYRLSPALGSGIFKEPQSNTTAKSRRLTRRSR